MIHTVLDEGFLQSDSFFVKLIRKYAVVLSCFLLVEIALKTLMPLLIDMIVSMEQNIRLSVLFYIPSYLMSIITAGIVHQDMKKTSSVSWPIIVLTCLFNELGVCFFLIYILYAELRSMAARK